jgi:hypothetical protein
MQKQFDKQMMLIEIDVRTIAKKNKNNKLYYKAEINEENNHYIHSTFNCM